MRRKSCKKCVSESQAQNSRLRAEVEEGFCHRGFRSRFVAQMLARSLRLLEHRYEPQGNTFCPCSMDSKITDTKIITRDVVDPPVGVRVSGLSKHVTSTALLQTIKKGGWASAVLGVYVPFYIPKRRNFGYGFIYLRFAWMAQALQQTQMLGKWLDGVARSNHLRCHPARYELATVLRSRKPKRTQYGVVSLDALGRISRVDSLHQMRPFSFEQLEEIQPQTHWLSPTKQNKKIRKKQPTDLAQKERQ